MPIGHSVHGEQVTSREFLVLLATNGIAGMTYGISFEVCTGCGISYPPSALKSGRCQKCPSICKSCNSTGDLGANGLCTDASACARRYYRLDEKDALMLADQKFRAEKPTVDYAPHNEDCDYNTETNCWVCPEPCPASDPPLDVK